ncbi:SSI family serine proteinase inhibitor [Nonomuraea sp. 10N515B]|uniref:SSI family serine proteinase inhibitor n=1 Tax=Nonomuraea sp. 10N515B TaxID=3457422 RepID=UPI003FCD607B
MNVRLTAARRAAAFGICVAAILTTPFGALPAGAAVAGAKLRITVTPDAGGGAYAVRLMCDPDRGGHPRPAAVCDALRAVDGRIEALDLNPGACPMVHLPVEVEVAGDWRGRPIAYRKVFSNTCVMNRSLSPLV